MYRAIAVEAIRRGVPTSDEPRLAEIAGQAVIAFTTDDPARILLDGRDVTEEIRTLAVGQAASELSVHPAVRRALVKSQKAIIEGGGYVLEGRDTTTVVAPNADLKIFLTASVEERARRRWLEMASKEGTATLQEVVLDVVQRDHRDYSRKDSPLTLAEDALVIESYGMTPPEVTQKVVRIIQDQGLVEVWNE